jgi:hypothetical protein
MWFMGCGDLTLRPRLLSASRVAEFASGSSPGERPLQDSAPKV